MDHGMQDFRNFDFNAHRPIMNEAVRPQTAKRGKRTKVAEPVEYTDSYATFAENLKGEPSDNPRKRRSRKKALGRMDRNRRCHSKRTGKFVANALCKPRRRHGKLVSSSRLSRIEHRLAMHEKVMMHQERNIKAVAVNLLHLDNMFRSSVGMKRLTRLPGVKLSHRR
jgi:hypothetical protein